MVDLNETATIIDTLKNPTEQKSSKRGMLVIGGVVLVIVAIVVIVLASELKAEERIGGTILKKNDKEET